MFGIIIMKQYEGWSQLFDLLEICSSPPWEREIMHLGKAWRHTAASVKGCFIFYVEQLQGMPGLWGLEDSTFRSPRSFDIDEGLHIKLSDGLFYTFGHGVEPEQFK